MFIKDSKIGWKAILAYPNRHLSNGVTQYDYIETLGAKLGNQARRVLDNYWLPRPRAAIRFGFFTGVRISDRSWADGRLDGRAGGPALLYSVPVCYMLFPRLPNRSEFENRTEKHKSEPLHVVQQGRWEGRKSLHTCREAPESPSHSTLSDAS